MPVPVRVSIPRRVFLGFALVLAVSGLVSVASFAQHQRTATTLELLHDGYLPLSLAISEVRAAQSIFDNLLDRLNSERNTASTRAWLNVGRKARPERLARALNTIALIQKGGPPVSERATLAKLRRELKRVKTALRKGEARYEELYVALDRGDRSQAERILADLRIRERSVDSRLRIAWTTVLGRIKATSARASAQQEQAIGVLLVLGLIALLVGVAVTVWSQRVLSPLSRLQQRVEAVARGELVQRLGKTSDDEIGRLAQEFERMVAALAARDQRLREASESLSQLQQTQAQILADLSAAVLVVGADGSLRVANPAAQALLGFGPDAVGAPLRDTGVLSRLPGLAEAMQVVSAAGESRALDELPLSGPQSRKLNVLVSPFDTDAASDGVRELLLVAEDVTDALATKSRLIQTERLAAIGRMAAHVTHEVRNPLSSIGLNVEMLEEELAGGQDGPKVLLAAIHREIERLTGITEEYLRMARVPGSMLEPEDVGDLVRGTADFMRRELQAAGVELEVQVARPLPMVAIDEAQFRQVLLNLLRNGREAVGSGGTVRVGVEATRAAPAQDRPAGLQIRVSDDGPGMDEETRARIFDLFYTTKKSGTGLGLPLTQQIVLAHAGHITCHSAPSKGTTFELWFPAAAQAEPPASQGPPLRLVENG